MEQIYHYYHYTGLIILWLSAAVGAMSIVGWLLIKGFNMASEHWGVLWSIHEFVYYRKPFMKWIEDSEKERHPKASKERPGLKRDAYDALLWLNEQKAFNGPDYEFIRDILFDIEKTTFKREKPH